MAKYYSAHEDSEQWRYTDIADAIEDCMNEMTEFKVGQVFDVYEGDLVTLNASDTTPDMVEYMRERAYDICGEAVENWLEGKEVDLQEATDVFIDEWCARHNCTPNFGEIKNVKPVEVKITESGWELVNDSKTSI